MNTFIAQGWSYSQNVSCSPPDLLNCDRKGKDYTYLYGKHVGTGSLTPYIDAAFDPRIEECVSILFTYRQARWNVVPFSLILDGEMLVWDPVSERNLPFGYLKTAALGSCGCLSDSLFR
jgi:ATP-dependent DNA ligase